MTLTPLFFYIFAITTILSGIMVIIARNPVHAVLWLILAFFSAAGLFILLGAEFLAMILVVVYVGAVAVLFLFVVMMIDVDFAALRAGFIENASLGALVGFGLLAELALVVGAWKVTSVTGIGKGAAPIPPAGGAITNTEAIGRLLYKEPYVFLFQAAGVILLVAMIGAIVLTLRHKENVKRQSVAAQVARTKQSAMAVVKVGPGEAIIPEATRRG